MLLKRRIGAAVAILFGVAIVCALPFWCMPRGNTTQAHFDVLVVLGHPAVDETTPDAEGQVRTLEAVHEYRRGVAPVIIVSGGRAHNQYVEAHAMAAFAESQGVPADAVVEEGQATNTVENLYYSFQIMKAHGWHSMEVVSEPSHLPRASFLARHFPVAWRAHASEWPPGMSESGILIRYCSEMAKLDLRMVGIPPTHYLHP